MTSQFAATSTANEKVDRWEIGRKGRTQDAKIIIDPGGVQESQDARNGKQESEKK